jgi:ORF6N domain-containing protein
MAKSTSNVVIPEEGIIKKILVLRGERVILDFHIAEIFGVETRALKQAVKRNMDRFPKDFMFRLSKKEMESVVSQNVIPHIKYLGGATPFAFTETGVAMLSGVLKSENAVKMNILIMRAFIMLRKIAVNYKEIMNLLQQMRLQYDKQFSEVHKVLEYLLHPPQPPRRKIGFRRSDENE